MTQTALDKLGGEDALRTLVEHFYDLMESFPETEQLRILHMDGHGMPTRDPSSLILCLGFWVDGNITWKNTAT